MIQKYYYLASFNKEIDFLHVRFSWIRYVFFGSSEYYRDSVNVFAKHSHLIFLLDQVDFILPVANVFLLSEFICFRFTFSHIQQNMHSLQY